MTVKRLPHLQKGRLETILLPVLVSAATAVVGNVARPAEEEDSKKNKSSDNIKVIKTEGKNSMVFVKDHRDDYEEYAGSTDDEDYSVPRRNNIMKNKAAAPSKVVDFQGTAVFIKTLLHALDCGGCNDVACRKMRLVLGHFLSCSRKSSAGSGQGCHLCDQLINIVALHAKHLCRERENGRPCPVPMCDAMRKEMEGETETAIEI